MLEGSLSGSLHASDLARSLSTLSLGGLHDETVAAAAAAAAAAVAALSAAPHLPAPAPQWGLGTGLQVGAHASNSPSGYLLPARVGRDARSSPADGAAPRPAGAAGPAPRLCAFRSWQDLHPSA